MATHKLSLAEFAASRAKLARAFWPAVRRGLAAGGQRARAYLVERTQQLAFDRGGAARGWKVDARDKSVTIYNATPYFGVIEKGRRPGKRQPPVAAIEPWVRRKVNVSYVPKSGKHKGQQRTRRARRDEAPAIAYLIARAIGRRGIKGKNVMGGALPKLKQLLIEEVGHEIVRALEGLGG